MGGLLVSRKFWLSIVGVVQVIVLDGLGVPMEIWGAIEALIVVLIGAIAIEDAGTKAAGNTPGE